MFGLPGLFRFIGLSLFATSLATPQGPAPATPPTFRSQSDLALIDFAVTQHGKYVSNIGKDDIEVREDGQRQEAAFFETRHSLQTLPTDVILAFDCSRQMRDAGFLNPQTIQAKLLGEGDGMRIAVYGFSDQAYRLTGTRDVGELNRAAGLLMQTPARPLPLLYKSI
ncbi:exported hypothetical protein [Candidatus Sulfopaludibacter sp. SbA3]|nr:exported hypothetical protein [Candidatus Sulfopaludibacter sp. SbA3]